MGKEKKISNHNPDMIAALFKNRHFKYGLQWEDITCNFANMVWSIQPQEAVNAWCSQTLTASCGCVNASETQSACSLRHKAHVANSVGNWYSCCIINAIQHFTMWCLPRSLWKIAKMLKFQDDLILIVHLNTCCNVLLTQNIKFVNNYRYPICFTKYCKENDSSLDYVSE